MATISITIGSNTVAVDFPVPDDKAMNTLLMYEEAHGLTLPSGTDETTKTATTKQKVEAVIREFAERISYDAKRYNMDKKQDEALKAAEAEYGLE